MSTLNVTNIKSSNGTSAITIDSTGRVLNSVIPRFSVYKSGTDQYFNTADSSTVGVAVTWATAEVNIGNHFDLSNNRFQVPVTGTYRFDISMLCGIFIPSSGINWGQMFFGLNGSTALNTRLPGTPRTYWEVYNSSGSNQAGEVVASNSINFARICGGGFADLTAGNTVQLMMQATDSSNLRITSGTQSLWSGYLIG